MKILLVDDDTEFSQLVGHRLKKDNYVVEFAADGEYAINLLTASSYSLVLLDLMLPKLNGVEVCQRLRDRGIDIPILMLTGRDRTSDKVTGLDAGADDYLVKPFELDELSARVRALMRRDSEIASAVIYHGPLRFDPRTQILTYREKPVSLRPKELAILELMLRYPTRVFAPDSILDLLWDFADCPGRATVKSHIRSLRKQLAAVGANSVIETVYGRGYCLSQALFERGDGDLASSDLASSDLASSDLASNQEIVAQAWEQVQTTIWHRLSRLEDLVNSRQQPVAGSPSSQSNKLREDREAAADILHQLKGTLGSFGFQSASLQAKHLEGLLRAKDGLALEEDAEFFLLQHQIGVLRYLLKQRMTADPSVVDPSVSKRDYVLVVHRDTDWRRSLQNFHQDSALTIKACSPLDIDRHLLDQHPAVILLEISKTEQAVDLSLLKALASNYKSQVPVIAVLETPFPNEHLADIQRSASAITLKSWSFQKLSTTIEQCIRVA